jgi:hypothetical protein
MKTKAFWDIISCSLIGVDRRFRGAYCFHHQGDTDDGGSTCRLYMWEGSHFHTCHHENLKSHFLALLISYNREHKLNGCLKSEDDPPPPHATRPRISGHTSYSCCHLSVAKWTIWYHIGSKRCYHCQWCHLSGITWAIHHAIYQLSTIWDHIHLKTDDIICPVPYRWSY